MRCIDKNRIEEKLRQGYPLSGRWHNGFHLEMPFGLINDPNGLAFFDGWYHIFFQWNPLGCEHKNKCWAYTKTEDFVHYSRPKLAMQPTDIHDKDGCYSGCGFEENGSVRVLYTCNSKDEAGVRTPAQRLGTLQADGTIRKDEIVVGKEAEGYTAHFRDPYVFKRDGRLYFVLGAQNEDQRGRAVVYESDGSSDWEFLGEIRTEYTDFGYMWECPNLLQFATGDVLLFCPQGLKPEEYAFQNRYQSGYVAGQLDLDGMVMRHGNFQELDRGFDFYAPQVVEQDGRHILFGWMGMPEEEALYPSGEDGWIYNLTVPRELVLKDGRLLQQPVRELQALRRPGSERQIQKKGVYEYQALLSPASELHIAIRPGRAVNVELALVYGEEQLGFYYDRRRGLMTIDRTGMKLGGRGKRSFKLAADSLDMHVLIDRSAVEVFFQQGAEAAAVAVFPEQEVAPQLFISGDAVLEALDGKIWELEAYRYI